MRWWMWMFLGAWLLSAGGCTCIIDADKYRGGGGDGDAGEIDAADNLPDAGQPDARLESDAGPIEPTSALEGEGSGTGAPPVMIVLRDEFAAGSTVRVVRIGDETETDLVTEPAVVSGNGDMLAFGIDIPVYDDIAEGNIATLQIWVDQGTGEALAGNFIVDGLPEADLSGTVDTDTMLRPLYSEIVVSGNVAFTGASPAILRSTTNIDVANAIDANGNSSTNGQVGGLGGPGGCAGGAVHLGGDCSIGGGEPGGADLTTGTGGGGGGHATDGTGGANGGDGGAMTGSEFLVPLELDRGNGGGGGGDGTTGSIGAGGGGGGVLELTAGGRIIIRDVVSANGGAGTNADGAVPATAEGSGGGGSGGAILIRAISLTGAGSLSATGAQGGNTFNVGGRGADGRTRIDVGSEAMPTIDVEPAAVRGPHWADDTPHLVTTASPAFTATLYGKPGTTFAANVDGGNRVDVITNGSGIGDFSITLEPGHNRICAIVSPTADLSLPEAVRCMIVTYVPE